MIVLTGIIALNSYSHLKKVTGPLESQIPEDVDALTETLELNALADLIKYYDEVLTMSARNYAFTSDKKWEQRYNAIVLELDRVLLEAIERGDETDISIFEDIDAANQILVEMEIQALESVSRNDSEGAIAVLESDLYWEQKEIYNAGLERYFLKRGSESLEVVQAATLGIRLTAENTNNLVKRSVSTVLILFAIFILLSIFISYFSSRSITKPIVDMVEAVEQISKGNFDVTIVEKSNIWEIDRLANALNRIMKTMKLAVLEKGPLRDGVEFSDSRNSAEKKKELEQKTTGQSQQSVEKEKFLWLKNIFKLRFDDLDSSKQNVKKNVLNKGVKKKIRSKKNRGKKSW